MYFAHFVTFLGLIVVAAGFVAFHFARKEQSLHLRVAGWVLVIGGALGLGCILYYSLKYWQQGDFARPAAMMMHHGMGGNRAPERESPEHQHEDK